MAGPTAGVELARLLSESQISEIWTMVEAISSHRRGEDFWVSTTFRIGGTYLGEGRPLILNLHGSALDECDEAEKHRAMFESAFGFRPVQNISIVAMCNSEEDHRILGEICLWLAERFGGIIDFGGPLLPRCHTATSDLWEAVEPLYREMVGSLPGRILQFRYRTARRLKWAFHMGDAVFLRAWLGHPMFHLVK